MSYVLVVDDNPLNANLARIVLSRAGHEVDTAGGAREALARVATRRPDVVVTDISMPEVSGTDLCHELRTLYGGTPLRIVAYTALAMREEIDAITDAGFDAVVIKPATKESLLAAVRAAPAMEQTS
ncbi:MAG: response regulator [Burkholderiales bacterium]